MTEHIFPDEATLIRQFSDEIDNYKATVEAIIAFAHEARWDCGRRRLMPNALFGIGYPLRTSGVNYVSPDTTVTPDLMLLIDQYGIIAEAKASLPRDSSSWMDELLQVKKYDDNLAGWPSIDTQPTSHDLVLLVHISRKAVICDFIQAKRENGEIDFSRPFSVVSFHRVDQRGNYIALERYSGKLSDPGLDERLRLVKLIPMKYLVCDYKLWFYDAQPPVPYLATFLWQEVFPSFCSIDEYVAGRELKKRLQFQATVNAITERAKQLCTLTGLADDCPTFPKRQWILQSLDFLRQLGLTRRISHDEYEICYKFIKDPQESFIRKAAQLEIKAREKASKDSRGQANRISNQLSLFASI